MAFFAKAADLNYVPEVGPPESGHMKNPQFTYELRIFFKLYLLACVFIQ